MFILTLHLFHTKHKIHISQYEHIAAMNSSPRELINDKFEFILQQQQKSLKFVYSRNSIGFIMLNVRVRVRP